MGGDKKGNSCVINIYDFPANASSAMNILRNINLIPARLKTGESGVYPLGLRRQQVNKLNSTNEKPHEKLHE